MPLVFGSALFLYSKNHLLISLSGYCSFNMVFEIFDNMLEKCPVNLYAGRNVNPVGFLTEFSALWFSTLLLCEYAGIIFMCCFYCNLLGLSMWGIPVLLFVVALLRSTINRMRFDELMSLAWQYCLPFVWTLLLLIVVLG